MRNPCKKLQQGIYLNYRSLSMLNIDLKVISKSYQGHRLVLCIVYEITSYLITLPLHQSKFEEIGNVLNDNVITKY